MIDDSESTYTLEGGSGNGAVQLISSDPGVVSINSNDSSLEVNGAGEAIISAIKAGDDEYLEASATLTVTVSRYAQDPLVFDAESFVVAIDDGSALNPFSGGSGEGTLTWSVADPLVAEVDEGAISPKAVGETQVTLTKAADVRYAETSASYTLKVVEDKATRLTTWIGLDDTLLHLENWDGIEEVYRYLSEGCDLSQYASCDDSELHLTNNQSVFKATDTVLNLRIPGWLQLANEEKMTVPLRVEKAAPAYPTRRYSQAVSFQGRLYLYGGLRYIGEDFNDSYLDDIWVSEAGDRWSQVTDTNRFTARYSHETVTLNGELLLMGGWVPYESGGSYTARDVWRSLDGEEWEESITYGSKGFSDGFDAEVFEDEVWVVGDYYKTDREEPYHVATIHSSENGYYWNQRSADAGFPPRTGHKLISFANKLWLIGGNISYTEENRGPVNDVWSSTNGVDWVLENPSAAFPARYNHEVVVYDNKLWLIGGYNYSDSFIDIWTSENGVDWELETPGLFDFDGHAPTAVVHEGDLWILGGLHQPHTSWRYNPEDGWRTPVHFEIEWAESE